MNKKKLIVLIICILLVVIAAVGACVMYLTQEEPEEFKASFVYNSDRKAPSYTFYTPDYNSDIFSDPDYDGVVVPYISYTNNAITYTIIEEDYSDFGPVVELFGNYFDSLKAGDAASFSALHSERFFKHNYYWESIAPQRLYNINIEYMFEKDMTDELYGEVTKYVYRTSYKIMKNDGTFRSDIGSDASRDMYLEIVYKNGELFIDAWGDCVKYPEE